MEQLKEFGSDHPIVAGSTFVIGGAVGAGLANHYLGLHAPYALGVGAATGLLTVAGAAYVDGWLHLLDADEVLDEFNDNVSAPLATGVNNTIYDATGMDLGGTQETAKYDKATGDISGRHQADTQAEREAMARLLITGPTKEGWAAVEQAVRESHGWTEKPAEESMHVDTGGKDEPPEEPVFTSNKENPSFTESVAESVGQGAASLVDTVTAGVFDLSGKESLKVDKPTGKITGTHNLDRDDEKAAFAKFMFGGHKLEDLDALQRVIAAAHG